MLLTSPGSTPGKCRIRSRAVEPGSVLGVAEAVLPDYHTKFSKRTFTQPRLLAAVCLMRYEDWTLRKTARFGRPSTTSCEALWAVPTSEIVLR